MPAAWATSSMVVARYPERAKTAVAAPSTCFRLTSAVERCDSEWAINVGSVSDACMERGPQAGTRGFRSTESDCRDLPTESQRLVGEAHSATARMMLKLLTGDLPAHLDTTVGSSALP